MFVKIPGLSQHGYFVYATVTYILFGMHFDAADIDYFHSLGLFSDDFLDYLAGFRFRGDISALPEGTIMREEGAPVVELAGRHRLAREEDTPEVKRTLALEDAPVRNQ